VSGKLAEHTLQGMVVLVTRPTHQAAAMLQLLEQKGAKPLAFASMEIRPVVPDTALKHRLSTLHEYDQLIFISVNAVEHSVLLLQKLKIPVETVKNEIAVIGRATQAAAEQAGLKITQAMKKGFNSESLLQLAAFQAARVNAKKILIFRGKGGLAQLGDTLQQRGAKVDYAEVYRRGIPQQDKDIKRQQLSLNWPKQQINAVTVTSNESLQNLYDMLEPPGRDTLLESWLIVPSQRCMQLAQRLGFQAVKIAESALNEHMLDALNEVMKNEPGLFSKIER